MSVIQNFKTFLALIIFSFIFFNYAKSENPKKSDVKLKEWEEHSENITILDLDYSIDSSASKTVSFYKFSYENISRFFCLNFDIT